MSKLALSAVALLLSVSLCFSLWNYTFTVTALDLNGKPVENAAVSIVYQKISALSEDDGLLSGLTDANGTACPVLRSVTRPEIVPTSAA